MNLLKKRNTKHDYLVFLNMVKLSKICRYLAIVDICKVKKMIELTANAMDGCLFLPREGLC